ncbi:MAG TPA: hypothetical protein VGG74_22695 [Kofleriaceae bacterium]|jgi:uncharacterized protein (TIGR02996 family)
MPAATDSQWLAALRREPLVYADWLLDRGDTRGELIVLQEHEAELDAEQLLRLLELSAEHGFMRLPDDPDDDVLRFAGGFASGEAVDYALVHGGREYRVIESGKLAVTVDGDTVYSSAPRHIVRPEAANVVLSELSDAIILGAPPSSLELREDLTADLRYRIGRFPTEPVPDDLAARWSPHPRHIDFRDLARWRRLAARWRALR